MNCKYKYELCQDCRQVFVPATYPLIFGKRLCTCCAINERNAMKTEAAQTRKFNQIHAEAV